MAAIILRAYQTQFDAHPAATLAATNGGLSAIADVVAQTAQMMVRDFIRLCAARMGVLNASRDSFPTVHDPAFRRAPYTRIQSPDTTEIRL